MKLRKKINKKNNANKKIAIKRIITEFNIKTN
jgi:hypothetical protein